MVSADELNVKVSEAKALAHTLAMLADTRSFSQSLHDVYKDLDNCLQFLVTYRGPFITANSTNIREADTRCLWMNTPLLRERTMSSNDFTFVHDCCNRIVMLLEQVHYAEAP